MSGDERSLRNKRTVNVADIKLTVQTAIDEVRDKIINDLTALLDNRLTEFENDISSKILNLENVITQKSNEIDAQQDQISDLVALNNSQGAEIDKLWCEVNELKTASNAGKLVSENQEKLSSTIIKNIQTVEERVEERTNRQMRKTLVIKGVQEDGKESWDDTRDIVASVISKYITKCSFDDAYEMLDRVHRSPPTKNPNKVGKRDIYAALNTWDDCEYLIDCFRKINRRNKNLNIYFDYKYWPLTTRRRNMALKRRRELLQNGDIVQGFISYPAKLIVKFNANDEYQLLENFSEMAVPDLSLSFVNPPISV